MIRSFILPFNALLLCGIFLFSGGCGEQDEQASDEQVTTEENTESEKPSATDEIADTLAHIGFGPVTELKLEAIDPEKAASGQNLFQQYCVSCHMMDSKMVGPPLRNVTERRSPEWIMNMMLNPSLMIAKDPIAKSLYLQYDTAMTVDNLTEEEARLILEYLRQEDSQ